MTMEPPISSIGADTLLALLDSHSDLDSVSLTALACTSRDFAEGVARLWPSKMVKYATECVERVSPPIDLWMEEEIATEYDEMVDLHEGLWVQYYGDKVRPESEKDSVRFEFDSPDNKNTYWNRQNAMMPVKVARRDYFLNSDDIRSLPCTRGARGKRFYCFNNVLLAGMLRHGRDGLMKKMLSSWDRKRRKGEMYCDRVELVKYLVLQHYSEPGMRLTPPFVQTYCKEYYGTGRGGLKEIMRRFNAHRTFSANVSLRSSSGLQPYLSKEEQVRVWHLQVAYVVMKDFMILEEAVKIVTQMRLA